MQNQQNEMHLDQKNDLKPHFGPFLALIEPILGPTELSKHLDHYQILNIITPNHQVQNWEEPMHMGQENNLKPCFGPFMALTGPF